MRRNVAAGSILRWADVEFDDNDTAVRARREMEVAFSDLSFRTILLAIFI